MSLPATPQEGFLVNVGELVCLTSVVCSGGSLYKIECARDNDACRVAKADDCVEAFAFGNCRGQEQGADQFQD